MNEWVGENDGIKYGRIFSYTVKANIHDPNCSHVSHMLLHELYTVYSDWSFGFFMDTRGCI